MRVCTSARQIDACLNTVEKNYTNVLTPSQHQPLSRSFPYLFWQKGYFHPFPLTMGIVSPLIFMLSCSFTSFYLFDTCVPQTGKLLPAVVRYFTRFAGQLIVTSQLILLFLLLYMRIKEEA